MNNFEGGTIICFVTFTIIFIIPACIYKYIQYRRNRYREDEEEEYQKL